MLSTTPYNNDFLCFHRHSAIYKVSNNQRQNHPTYCSPGSWFRQVVLHPFTFDCADVPTGVTSVTMARCMRSLAWHLAMKCHFWWWEVIFSLKLAWHQKIDCETTLGMESLRVFVQECGLQPLVANLQLIQHVDTNLIPHTRWRLCLNGEISEKGLRGFWLAVPMIIWFYHGSHLKLKQDGTLAKVGLVFKVLLQFE